MRRAAFAKTLACLAPALLAAFLVYFGSLSGEFVYDDNEQIVKNPWVHEIRYLPKTLANPVWAFQTPDPTNYYRPVQMGLYNLLWVTFGGDPEPFHVVNLVFHLLSITALFFLVKGLSRSLPTAAAASLLFAVHPLNTEAVDWIACLPDLSYAFFVLAAMNLHRLARREEGRRRRCVLRTLAVAAYALGLFSKETAVMLLPWLVLLELWDAPREEQLPEGPRVPGKRSSRRVTAAGLVRAILPYALATLGYLLVRLVVVGGMAPRVRRDLTPLDAVLNAPVLLLSYCRAMVAPIRLLAFHVLDRVPSVLDPRFTASLLGVALLVFLGYRLSRKRHDLALAAALVLLPLLPVLYIPAVGESAFAERYAYLSTAGAAWLAAGLLAKLVRKGAGVRGRAAWAGALALLVVPCGIRTLARTRDWHDDRSLAEATLKKEPRAWQMYVELANWYISRDRLQEALQVQEKGLAVFPQNPAIQVGVTATGLRLHRIGPEEAIRELKRVLERYPGFYLAEYDLGDAYLKTHHFAEAEAAFRRAIAINPMAVQAQEGLFVSLVGQGRPVDWSEARKRLANPPALRGRDELLEGVAEEKAGRLEQAEASLLKALRLEPRSDQALLSLAVVEDRMGKYAAAMEYCRRVIALKPDSADAYQQLGVSALKLGDRGQAVEALEKAVSIDPSDKEAQNRLGVAYVEAGRTADARAAFRKALALDPAFDKARFNLERLERGSVPGGGE